MIAEYISGAAAGAQRKYVHASYIDERCLMIDRTALGVLGAGAEEFFYYHTNNLYSVAALTNAAGAPVERYAYDAYGNPIILDALGLSVLPLPATGNPHLYTGRRLDEETGLYYYRARYYDAALGRFIGRDPIKLAGGLNLYSYADGSPTVATDPLGLIAWYNIGGHLGNWLAQSAYNSAAAKVRLSDHHYLKVTGCRVTVGFDVERLSFRRPAGRRRSAPVREWRAEATVFSRNTYSLDEFSQAIVDERRLLLEDEIKTKAGTAAINGVVGGMEFLGSFAPCGDAILEANRGEVSASGIGWCLFDVGTLGVGAVLSKGAKGANAAADSARAARQAANAAEAAGKSGRSLSGVLKSAGETVEQGAACIMRINCFEEGTLVLGPNRDREIQSIQVGQRVLTHARQKRTGKSSAGSSGDRGAADDDDDPDDPDDLTIHPENWRKITLLMRRPGGAHSEITLLRPVVWLVEVDAHVGGRIWLDMPEMSCRGWAEAAAIESCPPIEEGSGRVVTGTFHHSHGQVLDIHVDGVDDPIGATTQHPFWSEDRQQFIPAGKLRNGERLRTLSGLAHINSITARGPPQPVYNIEVSVDHTYLVTEAGVLVHNASGCRALKKGGQTVDAALDSTGKVHGKLPDVKDLSRYDADDLARLHDELEQSVQKRIEVTLQKGADYKHNDRIAAEQQLIKSIEKHLMDR